MNRPTLLCSLALAVALAACQKTPEPAAPDAAPGATASAEQAPAAKEGAAEPAAADATGAKAEPAKAEPAKAEPAAQDAVAGVSLTEFPEVTDTPKVRLLEAGEGEKKELRYRYSPESKHQMVMRLEMGMSMKVGERSMPEVKLPAMIMKADITMGKPEGDAISYEFSVPSAPEVEAGEGVSETVAQGLKTSLAAMTGLHGKASVDARGATRDGHFELEGKDSPQLAQLVDSMGQSMRQMSVPLPEEAVGKGARWQALQRMQMGGMTIYQVGEYTLESIDGDRLELDVKLSQLGPKQQMQPPGLPPGVSAELLSMVGEGSGHMKLDLTALVPVSTTKIRSDSSMRMTSKDEAQEMSMSMNMEMEIKPGDAQ
ncbi:MAG: hypothetical protein H6746_19655 [Deltaproteobacteria bacterium]|nr:hypothetical protein [Deltaproteobacteria bacterium]